MLCDNLEGYDGVGGRFKREGTYIYMYIYIYLWLIHVDAWQKPTHYCQAIILQIKINKYKKRNKTKQRKIKHRSTCVLYSVLYRVK